MDRLILSLMVINFAIHSYTNAFFFLAPYLSTQGYSPASAGILVGVFYAATTAVRPVGSWITERCGIKGSMICSSLLCLACAAVLQFYRGSFSFFVGIRIVMGIGFSIFMIALTTYQALVVQESKRGLAFALVAVGSIVPMFTVVPLTDFLIRNDLGRIYLLLPVAASALALTLALRLHPERNTGYAETTASMKWGSYRDLFRETPAWKILFSCFFFGLCDSSIVYIGSLLLEKGLVPSWFIFAMAGGALFVRTAGRNLFNRYPRTAFAGPSFLLMAICLLWLSYVGSRTGMVLSGLFYGMGVGYGYPAHLALTADLAPPRLRAKASALVHFSMDLSWFLLPLYMGFGSTLLGTTWAFRIFALFCLLTAVVITLMWLPRRRRSADGSAG
jgi:MFS family permease